MSISHISTLAANSSRRSVSGCTASAITIPSKDYTIDDEKSKMTIISRAYSNTTQSNNNAISPNSTLDFTSNMKSRKSKNSQQMMQFISKLHLVDNHKQKNNRWHTRNYNKSNSALLPLPIQDEKESDSYSKSTSNSIHTHMINEETKLILEKSFHANDHQLMLLNNSSSSSLSFIHPSLIKNTDKSRISKVNDERIEDSHESSGSPQPTNVTVLAPIANNSSSRHPTNTTSSQSTITISRSKQSLYVPSSINQRIHNSLTAFNVHDWLLTMGVSEYESKFIADGFDRLHAIIELNSDDLKDMNIPKGHRKMILRQVNNLQKQMNSHATHSPYPESQYSSYQPTVISMRSIPPTIAVDNHLPALPPDSQKRATAESTTNSMITDDSNIHTMPHTFSSGSFIHSSARTPNTAYALASLRVAIPEPIHHYQQQQHIIEYVPVHNHLPLPTYHPTQYLSPSNSTQGQYPPPPPRNSLLPVINQYIVSPQETNKHFFDGEVNDAKHTGIQHRYRPRKHIIVNDRHSRYLKKRKRRHSISSTVSLNSENECRTRPRTQSQHSNVQSKQIRFNDYLVGEYNDSSLVNDNGKKVKHEKIEVQISQPMIDFIPEYQVLNVDNASIAEGAGMNTTNDIRIKSKSVVKKKKKKSKFSWISALTKDKNKKHLTLPSKSLNSNINRPLKWFICGSNTTKDSVKQRNTERQPSSKTKRRKGISLKKKRNNSKSRSNATPIASAASNSIKNNSLRQLVIITPPTTTASTCNYNKAITIQQMTQNVHNNNHRSVHRQPLTPQLSSIARLKLRVSQNKKRLLKAKRRHSVISHTIHNNSCSYADEYYGRIDKSVEGRRKSVSAADVTPTPSIVYQQHNKSLLKIDSCGNDSTTDDISYEKRRHLSIALSMTGDEIDSNESESNLHQIASETVYEKSQYEYDEYHRGLAFYDSMTPRTKSHAMFTLNQAKELHRLGNVEQAAEMYARALHYNPNDTDVRIRYALCLLDIQEYVASAQQLDLLLTADPRHENNPMLQFVYGLLDHKRERFDSACVHYSKALKADYRYQDRIYNNLASLFRSCKDLNKAKIYQLKAIQLNPSNFIAQLNYAKILTDMHNFSDAIQAFLKAISLRPSMPDLHVEYGLFLMDILKDYSEAVKEFEIAHDLSPDNTEIYDYYQQAIDMENNSMEPLPPAYAAVTSKNIRRISVIHKKSKHDNDVHRTTILDMMNNNTVEDDITVDDSKSYHENERGAVFEILDHMNELQLTDIKHESPKIIKSFVKRKKRQQSMCSSSASSHSVSDGKFSRKRTRRKSLPMNLPPPYLARKKAMHFIAEECLESECGQKMCIVVDNVSSENTEIERKPRKSISEALPPPHNPRYKKRSRLKKKQKQSPENNVYRNRYLMVANVNNVEDSPAISELSVLSADH